jgi:UDP-N-acetylmuramoyl-L-alanyl-D-glutamate--2,6-diaminopimelate ligase
MNLAALSWLQSQSESAPLASDSRRVQPGDIFLAYPGDEGDGRRYIPEALRRGAVAIMFEARDFTPASDWNVPSYALSDLKQQAGQLAAAYYGQPSQGMTVLAVTGTNGKTTCAWWLAQALARLGQRSALMGTLGGGFVDQLTPTGYTTPDAVLLQRQLHELRDQGAQALAIEASSIGLHQGRLNGLKIDVAIFTNLSRDHLDYHGTMQNYEAAKAALFAWPGLKGASINCDDEAGCRLLAQVQGLERVVSYSLLGHEQAQLRATQLQMQAHGIGFKVHFADRQRTVSLAVIGEYNVANWLACCAGLLAAGFEFDAVVNALALVTAAPGRLQSLGGEGEPLIIVDYAHTPDALEKVLLALKPVARARGGKLICVVGCGGNRDPGKRPQMARVSVESAEHSIFTSDNPRYEDPQVILQQMLAGVAATASVQCVLDRRQAIRHAVRQAQSQDVILLAGKGHERTQEVAGHKQDFYDPDEAQQALALRREMSPEGWMAC